MVSSEELLSFFTEWEPNLKMTAIRWRIHDVKQKGVLQSVKLGIFTLQTKSVFEMSASDIGINVYKGF